MSNNEQIKITGARQNNLKNISLNIPKNKIVVITGVSGSGKSSLAFDTIYEEGRRRYLESLSNYARQFLGTNKKPDVDSIDGLSPSIAIDQKTTSHNPRSTVGTVTEIYDYLRVLYARIGIPYCPNNHGPIKTQTIKQIVDFILELQDNSKLLILAPISSYDSVSELFYELKREGYLRIRIDNEIYDLDEADPESIKIKNNVEVVIDRIVLHNDAQTRSRLNDAIESSLKKANGKVIVSNITENIDYPFNESYSCDKCDFSIKELEPTLFSFNSPIGACQYCKGLGFTYEPDPSKMLPDMSLSIEEGGIDFFKNTINTTNLDWQKFEHLLKHYQINTKVPLSELSKKEINYILYGSDEMIDISMLSANNRKYEQQDYVEGVLELVKRRHLETNSDIAREFYSKYMSEEKCKVCKGKKLNNLALSVKVGTKDITELTEMDITQSIEYLLSLQLSDEHTKISKLLLKEIIDRLSFLENVGLEYLTLSRYAMTLSGGESQRIRLASQIGSNLTGVLYVLDEPSIGLHQKDNDKLIETLKHIRDLGNTLIVVEHDEDTMLNADWIIDIGPGAGEFGGYITAQGTPQQIMQDDNSLTGKYLSKKLTIETPKSRRNGNGNKIVLKGATGNNLKNVDISIPLGVLTVITGVSGSGKSSLILETLVKGIKKENFNPFEKPLPYKSIIGLNNIDKIVEVTQEPIGRTPRSNPATYVGVFDEIRSVFANLKEAKEKGFSKGRFSFNVKGGRCERCQGDGEIKIDMHFLPSVYVKCEECNGFKYNEETLAIKFKSKSIYDVLTMSIQEALEFFKNFPSIHRKLQLLYDVGLGYLQLGTSSLNLSGGEAQRIKLAKFLQRHATGKTLFVLDEPTTGLHIDDVAKLIKILNRIVDKGDSVIVIEHNLDFIKTADYIIDVGLDGGNKGGKIISEGTPEQVCKSEKSYTAKYLRKVLEC